eukprot:2885744-Rhodomonas_salina.1
MRMRKSTREAITLPSCQRGTGCSWRSPLASRTGTPCPRDLDYHHVTTSRDPDYHHVTTPRDLIVRYISLRPIPRDPVV